MSKGTLFALCSCALLVGQLGAVVDLILGLLGIGTRRCSHLVGRRGKDLRTLSTASIRSDAQSLRSFTHTFGNISSASRRESLPLSPCCLEVSTFLNVRRGSYNHIKSLNRESCVIIVDPLMLENLSVGRRGPWEFNFRY